MGDERTFQEGGDICIHIADSLYCTAETGTILKAIIFQWVFIGRTDAEAETPVLLPPDVKS